MAEREMNKETMDMSTATKISSASDPRARLLTTLLGAVCLIGLLITAPAAAAPSWGIGMVHKNLYGVAGMVSMYDDSGSEGFARESGGNAYSIQVTNTSLSVGTVLTCEAGTWTGSPTFAYQWYRNGTAIPGATASTHTTEAADAGRSVQCAVTGTNAGGAFVRYTTPRFVGSAGSAGLPRAAEPVISASNAGNTGSKLTCEPVWGWRWPSFTFQWLKNGAPIAGATSNTYTIQAGDAPSAIQCLITAANVAGSVSMATPKQETSPAPSPAAPSSSVATGPKLEGGSPADVAGTVAVGQKLSCTGAPLSAALTYQWLRNGAAIPGATSSTYTLAVPDQGTAVQCQVLATTPEAAGLAISASTPVSPYPATPAPAPGNVTVSGTASVGSTLTCGTGTWAGSPSFADQWYRNGTSIPGATAATYVVAAGDLSTNIQCQVKGTNSGGTVAAQSGAKFIPPAVAPPTASAVPTVTGAVTVGSELTCNSGTWANGPTFSWEWLRSGTPLGITTQKYTVTAADEGKALQCRVTATNAQATAQAMSLNTAIPPVSGTLPPSLTSAGGISGVPNVGEELNCNRGTWANSPSTYTVQWLRNGIPIPGAVQTNAIANTKYKLVASDLNKVIQCMVTATNVGGSSVAILADSTGVQYVVPTAPNTSASLVVPDSVSVSIALPDGIELTGPNAFNNNTSDNIGFQFTTEVNATNEMIVASDWNCSVVTVTCTRGGTLGSGQSYPPIVLHVRPRAETADMVAPVATVFGGGATPPSASVNDPTQIFPPVPFGVHSFTAWAEDGLGASFTQAGGHPLGAGTQIAGNSHPTSSGGIFIAGGDIKSVQAELPPGFSANPQNFPQCPTAIATAGNNGSCPQNTAVGYIEVSLTWQGGSPPTSTGGILFGGGGIGQNVSPLWNVEPERGLPAQFAFKIQSISYVLEAKLRSDGDYGLTVGSQQIAASPSINGARVVVCDNGIEKFSAPQPFPGGKFKCTPTPSTAIPFINNPSKCAGEAPLTTLRANSYQHPDEYVEIGSYAGSPSPPPALQGQPPVKGTPVPDSYVTGCEELNELFNPDLTFLPDSTQADTPAGYNIDVHIPQTNQADTLMAPALKKTVATLGEGVSINPAAANGLGACTTAQMGLIGRNFPEPNPTHFDQSPIRCPNSSKVGTLEVETPLLAEPLDGSVYLAAQGDNVFDSTFAIYLGIDDPKTGLVIKLPGLIEADPTSGRLTATFDYNPQLPLEHIRLHFFGGPQASLANPEVCGEKATSIQITPWSAADPDNPTPDEVKTPSDFFNIDSGAEGAPCANTPAQLPFKLDLQAGAENTKAGASGPFGFHITRPDGAQEMTNLDLTTAPGVSASLKGIPYCSEVAIKAAEAKSGREESSSPSCPQASKVGTTLVGAGAGSNPFYSSGNLYLAGPYKGSPISVVSITPAVAGPFDLGDVVLRTAVFIDRTTAQVVAKTDPLPRILKGVVLRLRDVRVKLDRKDWTINPTSCDASLVTAQVHGSGGAVAGLSNRFQVGGCNGLNFKPKFSAKVSGGTKRNDHPSFRAEVSYPEGPGYANTKDVQVALPHSEFLDQSHINTVCTRVQAAAHECPAGSIYGYAEATTPLLDGVLTGPVFLKSSSHQLPDLAIALKGPDSQPIEVEFAGRIDSIHGQIRDTIEGLPDVPVTKFVLNMKGGKKGLLVNSRDLCNGKQGRMTVNTIGQNNKRFDTRPLLRNGCGTHKKHRSHKRHQKRATVSVVHW
jgi:hypothetical protein